MDPLLAARQGAYSRSFNLRTHEEAAAHIANAPRGDRMNPLPRFPLSARVFTLANGTGGVCHVVDRRRPGFHGVYVAAGVYWACTSRWGIALLVLALLRLALRLVCGSPGLPASTPRWQRLAAAASHWALYGFDDCHAPDRLGPCCRPRATLCLA